MGYLTVKVDMSDWGLPTVLTSVARKVEHAMAVQAMSDTDPYVPARTRSLANRSQVFTDIGPMSKRRYVKDNIIIYPGPYAHYLYYGKLMVDPETGSAWAKEGATKVYTDKNLVISQAVNPKAQSAWFEASKAQNLKKWIRAAAEAVEKYAQ